MMWIFPKRRTRIDVEQFQRKSLSNSPFTQLIPPVSQQIHHISSKDLSFTLQQMQERERILQKRLREYDT